MPLVRGARVDRMLRPVHRWIWGDFERRVRKLLAFAEVEGDGGRDILRAAEVTRDPLLRRLYLAHAIDELRHSDLLRHRAGRSVHARDFRGDPARRNVSHELHVHAAHARLAAIVPAARVAGACEPPLETLPAGGRRAHRSPG